MLSKSRILTYNIYPEASEVLKNGIFVNMKHDQVFERLIQDETIIRYGNMLTVKYSSSAHHNNMICQHLRQITRILLTVNNINCNVKCVKDMLSPCHYEDVVKAIHQLAGLNNGKYKSPSVANHSCTIIMHFLDYLKYQSIKDSDAVLRKQVDDFHDLLKHSQNAFITKLAGENRTQHQRTKMEMLPSTEEVKHMFSLLQHDIKTCQENIAKKFSTESWCKLSKLVLIAIMIFNRKRPGDIEKTHIVEYNSLVMVDEESKERLGRTAQECASTFGRFISRGKLNKPAPTLVSKDNMAAIDLILKYREVGGVSKENKYVFANVKGAKYPYFKADQALKEFCLSNKLSVTKFLATKLRKHLATITSDASKEDQILISDFMGHHIDIHNNIYRQRQAHIDIVKMGTVLTNAIGSNFEKNAVTKSTSPSSSSSILGTNIKSTDENSRDNFQIDENSRNSFQIDEDSTDNFQTDINLDGNCQEIDAPSCSSNTPQMFEPHDLSVIEESPKTPSPTFKRRSRIARPPLLRNSRRTWRTPERQLVKSYFKKFLDRKKVPSLSQCQDLIHKHSITLSRTPQQVQSWISAQIKRSGKGKNVFFFLVESFKYVRIICS